MSLLFVFLGGGLGALGRYALGEMVSSSQGYNILLPNLIGCFLIGVAVPIFNSHEPLKLLIIVGFLGGFTTFSSYVYLLSQSGLSLQALTFALSHHVFGVGLFALGFGMTRWLVS